MNYCNCDENMVTRTLLLIFPEASRVFSLHFDIVESLKSLRAAYRLQIQSAYSDADWERKQIRHLHLNHNT